MKLQQTLLALAVVVPLWGQAALELDKDVFLHHVQSWRLPEYPRKSTSKHRAGVVTAKVGVDAQGHVSSVNIVSSPDVHFAETVKLVVSRWVFRPFIEAGNAKPAEATIYVEFRLKPTGPNVIIPGLTQKPLHVINDPYGYPEP